MINKPRTSCELPATIDSKINRLLIVLLIGLIITGCASGLPELRPGYFEKPTREEDHGWIVEKHFRFYNGPRTVFYSIFEIDGKPVRIKNGFVEFTSYCKVDGINAVAFSVKGKPGYNGRYILQIKDKKQTLLRLSDYGSLGRWEGAVYNDYGVLWDAEKMTKTIDP